VDCDLPADLIARSPTVPCPFLCRRLRAVLSVGRRACFALRATSSSNQSFALSALARPQGSFWKVANEDTLVPLSPTCRSAARARARALGCWRASSLARSLLEQAGKWANTTSEQAGYLVTTSPCRSPASACPTHPARSCSAPSKARSGKASALFVACTPRNRSRDVRDEASDQPLGLGIIEIWFPKNRNRSILFRNGNRGNSVSISSVRFRF